MRRLARLAAALAALATVTSCANDFQCTVDYECPGAEVCNLQSGECEQFTCERDEDCPNPIQRCQNQRCVEPAAK